MHVASALRLGAAHVTIVTHDAQMARAAVALGFVVFDPEGDDPGGAGTLIDSRHVVRGHQARGLSVNPRVMTPDT